MTDPTPAPATPPRPTGSEAGNRGADDDSRTRWAVWCADLGELVGIGYHTPIQAEAFAESCMEAQPDLAPFVVVPLRAALAPTSGEGT